MSLSNLGLNPIIIVNFILLLFCFCVFTDKEFCQIIHNLQDFLAPDWIIYHSSF